MFNSKENKEEIESQQILYPYPSSPQIDLDTPHLLDPSRGMEYEIKEDLGEDWIWNS